MRIASVLSGALVCATCLRAANLLQNPGFEEVEGGKPIGWATSGHPWYEEPKGSGLAVAALDDAVLQGAGHRSLRLAGTGNRGIVRQALRRDPAWGQRLRLAGWMRLQDTGSACGRLTAEFLGEANAWLGQAGVATDWRKSTADWEHFEREFELPEATRHVVFSCNTDKATRGTVWFDNLVLEPVAALAAMAPNAPAPAQTATPTPAAGPVEALVPIDTFETPDIAWRANAWGGSTPARFSVRPDGAAVGSGHLRVECPSAKANMVDRGWNYDGPWDGLTFQVRGVSGGGGLTLYYVCGGVYFHAAGVAPGPEWQQVSVRHAVVRYGWGAKSEEEKVFDPRRVTKLSFGHDEVIVFDLDHVAVDVSDAVAVRAAYSDTRANLFAPGGRPTVKAELLNAYRQAVQATLAVTVVDDRGHPLHEESRPVPLAPRAYRTEAVTLPALQRGYSVARVQLLHEGRVAGQRAVGLCALPEPTRAGKPFVGASGFGLNAGTADIGHRLGVQAAEVFVSWARCEPERGELRLDEIAKTLDAYARYGFEVTGMVLLRPDDVPAWASAAPDPKERHRHFAKDPADFARFMGALVGRYRDRIEHWSFCCEVDLAVHQWARGFDGYVEMCRAGAAGAKRADPGCVVGGVGVSGVDCTRNPRFPVARRLWEQLGDALDGLCIDAYASPRYFAPGLHVVGPEENDEIAMLEEALAIARRRGPAKRLAIEEKGWAIDDRLPVDAPAASDMADVLARSFIMARSVDAVEHYMWFQLVTPWAEGGYSYSLFRAEGDHFNPRPAVTAYAAVAHFLAGVSQPRRIALHQDLYAFAFAAGAGSRAALWTPLADEVSIEVTLPASARLADRMGNEIGRGTGQRQGLRLSRSPLYVWDDATPVSQCAAALAEASFHLPCARLAFSVPDVRSVQVLVRSQVAGELHGRLSVSAPPGWQLSPAYRDLRLPADTTVPVRFDATAVPRPLPRRPGLFTVRFAGSNRGEVRLDVEPVLYGVPRLTTPPAIDGDLGEYAALAPIRLDNQSYLYPPDAPSAKLWTGIDDLSVTAWVAWDADCLYFAAKVRDDRHVQERHGTQLWANDGFQIGLDPLNDATGLAFAGKTGYDPDDAEFGIALAPAGPQTFQWTGAADPNGCLVATARLAVCRVGDETCYEWALPWPCVKAMQPKAGTVFGLSFVAIDADKPGESAPYWMGLTPGICGGKDPAAFPDFVLQE